MSYTLNEYYKIYTWADDFTEDSTTYTEGSVTTFSDINDAKTKIGLGAVFDTSSPSKTYALSDDSTALKVSYVFTSSDDMKAFTDAVASYWTNSGSPFSGTTGVNTAGAKEVRLVKQEHLSNDGSILKTINHPM